MEIINIKIEGNLQEIAYYLWALGYTNKDGNTVNPKEYAWAESFTIQNNHVWANSCAKNTISLSEFKLKYPITKHHLKPGMVVEYRNGNKRYVMNSFDGLFLADNANKQDLCYYHPNLIEIDGQEQLDIMKVYIQKNSSTLGNTHWLELIWERPEIVELTIEDIAKKLGIDPQLIRIKSEKD